MRAVLVALGVAMVSVLRSRVSLHLDVLEVIEVCETRGLDRHYERVAT
jgi:hypothetical protein